MKKVIYITTIIALAALMTATSCNKQTPDRPFTVEMAQTSVNISASAEGIVDYVATNYSAAVHVTLPSIENITLSDEYDPATGKGVIHIATSSICKSYVMAKILFTSGSDKIEKYIIIETKSAWAIEPDNPSSTTE